MSFLDTYPMFTIVDLGAVCERPDTPEGVGSDGAARKFVDVFHMFGKCITSKAKYACIVDAAAVGRWFHKNIVLDGLETSGVSSSGPHDDVGASYNAGVVGLPICENCTVSVKESVLTEVGLDDDYLR